MGGSQVYIKRGGSSCCQHRSLLLCIEGATLPVKTVLVKKWIHENLRCIRTIDDIASVFGVSPETLRKSFVRGERTALSDFVTHERVERAKSLLLSTRLRCFEIAYHAGFSREDVGAKAFRRLTGETMEHFRKSRVGGKDEESTYNGSRSSLNRRDPFYVDILRLASRANR